MRKITIENIGEDYYSEEIRNFLDSCRQTSFYHRPEWLRLIQSVYDYKPHHHVATQNGRIVGLLPLFEINSILTGHRLVSLPFTHLACPATDNEYARICLINHAVSYAKSIGIDHIIIKQEYNNISHPGHTARQPFFVSSLDLSNDTDSIWSRIKPSTRRNIHKAEKSGIRIVNTFSLENIRVFYDLMVETRQRQGVPVYPSLFFENLYQIFSSNDYIRLYLAYINDAPVAGLICSVLDQESIYLYGASSSNPGLLNKRPNDLLFWRLINELKLNNCTKLDLGLTHVNNKGLLRFKEAWGATSMPVDYIDNKTNHAKTYNVSRYGLTYQLTSSLIKILPIKLYKRFSSLIMSHFG